MRKRKTHEDASKGKEIQKQNKRLSQIIENFLEEALTLEDLMKDPDKIEHLRNLINKNLFENTIDIFDWDWEFESKYPRSG